MFKLAHAVVMDTRILEKVGIYEHLEERCFCYKKEMPSQTSLRRKVAAVGVVGTQEDFAESRGRNAVRTEEGGELWGQTGEAAVGDRPSWPLVTEDQLSWVGAHTGRCAPSSAFTLVLS